MNVNTAPAPVLRALFAALSDAALERVLSARDRNPFVDGNAMIIQAGQAPASDDTWDVRSGYFLIDVRARFGTLSGHAGGLVSGLLNGVPGKLLWMGENI